LSDIAAPLAPFHRPNPVVSIALLTAAAPGACEELTAA
jgi:hypothetical protein